MACQRGRQKRVARAFCHLSRRQAGIEPWLVTNLEHALIGARLVIVAVADGERLRLARHGLVPGVELVCDQDAPLHGPRIVSVGHRRVSVPRVVAREVTVLEVATALTSDA